MFSMPMSEQKNVVYVGMSGGVDSSVSASLLKEAGFKVVGVFIKVWEPEGLPCTSREDRREAMRVSAHLDIPLVTWDLADQYKEKVIDYMIGEYRAGRTPNPDVMCNKEVKFGLFYDTAMSAGADFVATGHYAQIKDGQLLAGNDTEKDQSYFLWAMRPGILPKVKFPVGHLPKSEVRKLAQKFRLPNADRKDSQGLCFIGKFDFKEFLKETLKPTPGEVLAEDGQIIGTHEGAILYTVGERHGFEIFDTVPRDQPYYVIGKNIADNTIRVSTDPAKTNSVKKEIVIENINWTSGTEPVAGKKYQCRVRYRGELHDCQFVAPGKIIFDKPVTSVAPGQSAVIYDGKILMGGGIIK